MGRIAARFRRWKFSFQRSAGSKTQPPKEFICPISNSLMSDPAVLSNGQSFDQVSVRVCRDLGFTPTLPDGSTPDFSTAIPNLALKAAIDSWCSKSGSGRPNPPSYSDVESIVRSLSGSAASEKDEGVKIRVSERELLDGVSENPAVLFSHSVSELNQRDSFSSSSSEASVIANTTPLLPFATRPSCLSPSPSHSNSPESPNYFSAAASISSEEGEDFTRGMTSSDDYKQEEAVIRLRKTTRSNEEDRAALCTEELLFALKELLDSRYAAVQTNATAALVNLSLERSNKVKIVRAGLVPRLIDILKNGFEESREHAAGAIFSLALDDNNKTAIGVLGALPPLLHLLRSGTRRSRHDAALALYHLTLAQSNRIKIVKLGAAAIFLGLLKDAEVASRVVLAVCNLAACDQGRAALLDADAVQCLVGSLRNATESISESTRDNCVAALHSLSRSGTRFQKLAAEARAAEALQEVAESGSERAKVKARKLLAWLNEAEAEAAEEGEEVDWEAVMRDGATRARHRNRRTRWSSSTELG